MEPDVLQIVANRKTELRSWLRGWKCYSNKAPVKGYREIANLLTPLAEHEMKAMKKGLASKAKTA